MELTIAPKKRVKRNQPVILTDNGQVESNGSITVAISANDENSIGQKANDNTAFTLPEGISNSLTGNEETEMPDSLPLEINAVSKAEAPVSTSAPFIQANTIEGTLKEIKEQHIIPVFIKDNEHVISHADFIDAACSVVHEIYNGESILAPSVRLSHPIKGRIPEARNKPAAELLEHEKTLYYERMAFVIEVPTIHDEIDGNRLSLCIGGVKAYNLDNLYSKKGADEHFKIFIGFKNTVCTNLCVWTDGFMGNVKVSSLGQLQACIRTLIDNYNAHYQLLQMQMLAQFSLTEQQFATLIGKCRMYQHLPQAIKNDITPLLLGDSQLNTICKDYFADKSFCRDDKGNINLWKLYNLLTGANKSSYIDNFIDRSVNAYHFAENLRFALQSKATNWFIH